MLCLVLFSEDGSEDGYWKLTVEIVDFKVLSQNLVFAY